jgi:excisionase family DNA binding protein
MPDQLMTPAEVAKELRVDQTTVKRWIYKGALEAVVLPKTGSRTVHRVRRSTLINILGLDLGELDTHE